MKNNNLNSYIVILPFINRYMKPLFTIIYDVRCKLLFSEIDFNINNDISPSDWVAKYNLTSF